VLCGSLGESAELCVHSLLRRIPTQQIALCAHSSLCALLPTAIEPLTLLTLEEIGAHAQLLHRGAHQLTCRVLALQRQQRRGHCSVRQKGRERSGTYAKVCIEIVSTRVAFLLQGWIGSRQGVKHNRKVARPTPGGSGSRRRPGSFRSFSSGWP
jgi:hypothetical protein